MIENTELNNKLLSNEIPTEDNKEFKPIPKETLDILANPAAIALENALSDLKQQSSQNIVSLKQIMHEIHMILLMDGSQYNNKILCRLHELIPYLKFPQLYNDVIMIFTDISHYNSAVQNILIKHNLFSMLDYTNPVTIDLIFNICDQNETGIAIFKKKYYIQCSPQIQSNEKLKKLFSD